MTDNPFQSHHDFYDTHPPLPPKPEDDPRVRERRANRNIVARTFLTEEGKAALPLIRALAAHLPHGEPINVPDADKANQLLLWRAARTALIDEIEAIVRQETNT